MYHIELSQESNEYLDNVLTAYPNNNVFYLNKGTYKLTSQLHFNRNDVVFIGITEDPNDVHIIQENDTENALFITANNVAIKNISIHVNGGTGMCLYQKDASWTNIENCHFYNMCDDVSTPITVYFAGTSGTSEESIANFQSNSFGQFNMFDGNVIFTQGMGTSVSFNLQQFGSVRDNIIRGGKISLYLNKDCMITHNTIHSSKSHGILGFLPMENIKITNNVIKLSESAAINFKTSTEFIPHIDLTNNIEIIDNNIDSCKYIAVELNNTKNITFSGNTIKWTSDLCIYALKSKNISFTNNSLIQHKRGIHIDIECENITFDSNEIYSIFPTLSEHAVVIEDTAINNTISNNTIYGHFSSVEIKILEPVVDFNTVFSNILSKYIPSSDNILKLH